MKNILLILFLLAAGGFATKTSAQAVILKSDTLEVSCTSTDTFAVPLKLDNFTNVAGLQFTLQWDTARLDYAFVAMLHPQFAGAGFDTLPATIAEGRLTFAWTNLAGVSLPPDAVLFQVAFRRIGGPQTPVAFTNDPTAITAFDNQLNELLVETHNGAVKPIDDLGPTISCPANVLTSGTGPTAIPNIPPVLADNCGAPAGGWSAVGATVANFPSDADASGALFNLGTSTVTYTATDAGGNTATCAFDILVDFAVSSTDLTLIASPNNAASCGETVTIDVLAYNFDSIAGLQFSMGWLPASLGFVSVTNTNASLNIVPSNFNTDSTGVGYLTFAWISTNLAGSSVPDAEVLFTLTYNVLGAGTVAFGSSPTAAIAFTGTIFPPEEVPFLTVDATITVTDTLPPSISCPADVTVQSPGATAVQGIAPLSVTDNCAAPLVGWSSVGVTTSNAPNDPDASGALFNLGTSTVTYTATDAGGNTATCSFNVTVEFAATTDLTIIANSANAACGGNFSMDVTALNFETIAGVQFTVNWDPALYQFTSVSNFNLPIGVGVSNFGVDSAGLGYITFAWTTGGLNGSTVSNGEVLFSLNFDLLTNTSSGITFGDDPTVRVAFDGGTFDEITMVTVDGQVSVVDNVPPTIACPASVTVVAPQGQLFAPVTGLEPTTLTDNCVGIPGLSYTQTGTTTNSGIGNANGNYNAGTTTVVYTATDANGNTATCSFQVVVDAGTAVVLQLDTVDLGCQGTPTQITVNLTVENFIDIIGLSFGLNWDPAVLSLVTPVPIFYITAGVLPPISVNQTTGTLSFFGGDQSWPNVPDDSTILQLTFNVLDVNGLANTDLVFIGLTDALDNNFQPVPVQTINGAFVFTLDNVPPTVTCPTDTVLNAAPAGCTATFLPLTPAATDDCGNIASITVSPDTTLFSAGTPTVLTYTVTDDAGNSSTCAISVTVLDDTAPGLSGCPVGPILADADSNCQAIVTWTNPTFLDACDANPTIVFDYLPGNLFTLGTTLVNITATDASDNATTCSFEVLVRDVTPPTIVCPADTVIVPIDGCAATVNFAAPVATDNCDSAPNIICSSVSGSVFTGITTVTCAAVDDEDNAAQCDFTITVSDGIAPQFPNGCPTSDTIPSASGNCGANPTWQAPLATDNCDQSLSVVSAPLSGGFLAALPTPHTITFTATDDLGNTGTCTFTILVQDVTAPVLTNCPTLPILVVLPIDSCTVVINWTPPTVNDNCGIGGVLLIPNIASGSVFNTGDTTVVYTATDASGNSSTCSFSVSVKDVVPPSFGVNCPTTPFVENNGNPCGVVVDWTFPLATDNCTPANELVYTSSYDTTSSFPPGTTTFPVRVTDASGNFVECEVTVIVMGQSETFIDVPGDITVTMCDAIVSWIPPTPVGFCPPVTVVQGPLPPGSIFPFGTTTVIYTATDTSGNAATATFNVIVSENVPPVFDCPVSPIVVSVAGIIISDPSNFLVSANTIPGCTEVELNFNLPNATDDCVTPTVTQMQGLPSGDDFPIGFNNLVFRAVDSSGNFSECAVFIEVAALPGLAPVVNPIPGCSGDTVIITAANIPGAIYTWVGPVTSTTNVVTIGSLSSQNDGPYIVTASLNGCTTTPDTAIVYMTVAPMAENDLTYTINPGETVTFSSVFENDLLSPAFDFAICDTSVLPGLNMNFTDGTFSYTAGEEPGMVSFIYKVCSRTCPLDDQAAVTITINDTKCVFIPNIITPNGDDTNDWFTIPCIETGLFRENSLVVYNQWGDQVYEAAPYSNDQADAWRGTLNGESGKDLPDGVYFYIFKPGPNIPPMKGFVEIFR